MYMSRDPDTRPSCDYGWGKLEPYWLISRSHATVMMSFISLMLAIDVT